MDIGAWERRTTAVEGLYELGYDLQEEEQAYYDDAGEPISYAEHEELLFRRVLAKIRVARATGDSDVQLSPEELEAYQSRLHGNTASAARPQPRTRPADSPVLDDAASVLSANTTGRHDAASSSKSKSKKSQPRTSLFSSKPKKEKPSSRKRAVSSVSSGSGQVSPGFVAPGPDGHPLYTAINSYQGNLARDPRLPSHATSHSTSGNHQVPFASSRMPPPQPWQGELPGAFPGAYPGAFPGSYMYPAHVYRPMTPPRPGQPGVFHQSTWDDADDRIDPDPVPPAKLMPFPVEPYQYHSFSPSSSSQPSPQLQYTRRPSAPPSEASYTSMPRRVPVPAQHTPPVSASEGYPDPAFRQPSYSASAAMDVDDLQEPPIVETSPQPIAVQAKSGGNGKDGERRRKGAKSKKKS